MNRTWRASMGILMVFAAVTGLTTGCQQSARAATSAETANIAETVSTAESAVSCENKVIWGQQMGSLYEDLTVTIAVDAKGNSYAAGYTLGDVGGVNKGDKDILVTKLDSAGNVLWTLQEGSDSNDSATYIVLNAAGEIYITGNTNGSIENEQAKGRVFIQKISNDGKLLWTKQYGGEDRVTSNAIRLDDDENLYIAGTTNGKMGEQAFGNNDAYLNKLDSEGNLIWSCQWGTEGNEEIKGIDLAKNGDIYAIGDTTGNIEGTNAGITDLFVSRIDSSGKVNFNKQFGTPVADTATKVMVDTSQNIYLSGWTSGDFAAENLGSDDCVLLKLSSSGNLIWKKQFGTPLWDGIHGMVLSKEDPTSVIVGGCQNFGDCQAFLRKFDAEGNEVWKKEQIPEFSTCGREIAIDDQGIIYQTGGTHGQLYSKTAFEGTESDLFVNKISEK